MDKCGTCSIEPVPAHPGKLLDNGGRGYGEGKAPSGFVIEVIHVKLHNK